MFEKEAIKERREFNKEVYEKIFCITGKPKKILDLGCGLNPLSFPYKEISYSACDVNLNTLKKVKKHFKKNNVNGKIFYLDLKDFNIKDKFDLVFIFKVLDIFNKRKKIIEDLFKKINAKYLIVSFSTRTIEGKRMNNPKRKWFENILKKLNLKYKNLRYFNEIFYIIKK